RKNLPRDREVAALDREPQILQRPRLYRDRVNCDAELVAEHAARIAHAARLIDGISGRRGLDRVIALIAASTFAVGQYLTQMRVVHERAADFEFGARGQTLRLSALYRQDPILDAV